METLVIEGVDDHSICVKDNKNENIAISHLNKCFVYILKEVSDVTIENCEETTIFIAKSNTVTIKDCNNMNIICFTAKMEIISTTQTSAFLFVIGSLSIKSGSVIVVAPYNCCVYSDESIIPSGKNIWDKPEVEEGSSFSIMEPNEFKTFVVPFGNEPKGILAPLPSAYSRALQWRERIIEERRQLVMEFCKRAPSYANEIQEKISNSFKKQILEDPREGRQVQQLAQTIYY